MSTVGGGYVVFGNKHLRVDIKKLLRFFWKERVTLGDVPGGVQWM